MKYLITSEFCGWIFKADKQSWGMRGMDLQYASLYESEKDAKQDLYGNKALSPVNWRHFTKCLRIVSIEEYHSILEIQEVMSS